MISRSERDARTDGEKLVCMIGPSSTRANSIYVEDVPDDVQVVIDTPRMFAGVSTKSTTALFNALNKAVGAALLKEAKAEAKQAVRSDRDVAEYTRPVVIFRDFEAAIRRLELSLPDAREKFASSLEKLHRTGCRVRSVFVGLGDAEIERLKLNFAVIDNRMGYSETHENRFVSLKASIGSGLGSLTKKGKLFLSFFNGSRAFDEVFRDVVIKCCPKSMTFDDFIDRYGLHVLRSTRVRIKAMLSKELKGMSRHEAYMLILLIENKIHFFKLSQRLATLCSRLGIPGFFQSWPDAEGLLTAKAVRMLPVRIPFVALCVLQETCGLVSEAVKTAIASLEPSKSNRTGRGSRWEYMRLLDLTIPGPGTFLSYCLLNFGLMFTAGPDAQVVVADQTESTDVARQTSILNLREKSAQDQARNVRIHKSAGATGKHSAAVSGLAAVARFVWNGIASVARSLFGTKRKSEDQSPRVDQSPSSDSGSGLRLGKSSSRGRRSKKQKSDAPAIGGDACQPPAVQMGESEHMPVKGKGPVALPFYGGYFVPPARCTILVAMIQTTARSVTLSFLLFSWGIVAVFRFSWCSRTL